MEPCPTGHLKAQIRKAEEMTASMNLEGCEPPAASKILGQQAEQQNAIDRTKVEIASSTHETEKTVKQRRVQMMIYKEEL